MIDIESNFKPNCRGKLKLTYQAAPYWIYVFSTFSVIRKEGQDVGLRINKKLKNATASDCEKYIILGDPNIDFTLPINLQLKPFYRDEAIIGTIYNNPFKGILNLKVSK